jgi:hypothetical protein
MSTVIRLGFDQETWTARAKRWAEAFPDLHALAREQAQSIVHRHTGLDLDPDTLWWHRFDSAISSPRTFTGWQHSGRPLESMTLVQLLVQRFAARDQDSLDNLQVEGGFYTDDATRGVYDERNEVRMLAWQVAADFWALDFASLYRARLSRFWHEHSRHFNELARITLWAEIAKARQAPGEPGHARERLSQADLRGWQAVLTGRPGFQAHSLRLGSFTARDVLRIVLDDGRQLLYLPGDSPALRSFDDTQALYAWIRHCAGEPVQRALLVRHFTSANPMATDSLTPLHRLLDSLRDDSAGHRQGVLESADTLISADPFDWLRESARADMTRQADRLLVSNAHLRRQLWIGYLGAFISLGSGFAPLGWPAALILVGAGLSSFILNVHKAVQATTAQERRAGIVGAITSAIVVVFNAPLLSEASLADEAALTAEQGSEPVFQPVPGHEDLPLIPLTVPGLPAGGTINSLGMIERTDIRLLFWVQELPRGTSSSRLIDELRPVRRFSHAARLREGDVLRTFATPTGALHYAQSAFDGPFVMFEVDAEGLPAASLRENLTHNARALCQLQGEPLDSVSQRAFEGRSLNDFAEDGWLYDEVHLGMDGLDRSRLSTISAQEVERLSGALAQEPVTVSEQGPLRGVKILLPNHGRQVTTFSIEVERYRQNVRYDPWSDTWRTRAGRAYRFNEARGQFFRVLEPGGETLRDTAQIDQAMKQLGIDVTLPWEMPPLSRVGARALPRKLHSVWLGRHMPRRFIRRVLDNAAQASQADNPFECHLYLSIDDAREAERTLAQLAKHPGALQVHTLEDMDFFKDFQQTPYYRQFQAARSGPGLNYPSAVDVLRYRLLHSEGGLYMDVDDLIEPVNVGEPGFAERDFELQPGHLLLNNLVFHRRMGMLMDFNTSNFGSLPGNPLLDRISEESYRRFLADPGLYQSRPYDFSHTESEMDAYARRISYTTGPGVFNSVIDRELPVLRQYRNLHRLARGEIYLSNTRLQALVAHLRPRIEEYSALGGLIRIGSTGSWLHT